MLVSWNYAIETLACKYHSFTLSCWLCTYLAVQITHHIELFHQFCLHSHRCRHMLAIQERSDHCYIWTTLDWNTLSRYIKQGILTTGFIRKHSFSFKETNMKNLKDPHHSKVLHNFLWFPSWLYTRGHRQNRRHCGKNYWRPPQWHQAALWHWNRHSRWQAHHSNLGICVRSSNGLMCPCTQTH